jgi:hypothetical protein
MFHDRIKKRAQDIGIKNGTLAYLISVSPPKLSAWFKGRLELPSGKDKALDTVLTDLAGLQKCFPVALSLDDAKILADTLDKFRRGKYKKFKELTEKFAKENHNDD